MTTRYDKPLLISMFLTGLFFCNGCFNTVVHVYDGKHLPREKTAKVVTEFQERTASDSLCGASPSFVLVKKVDGKNPKKYGKGIVVPLQIFVLPGPHSFDIEYSGPRTTQAGAIPNMVAQMAYDRKYNRFNTSLTFTVQAGRDYVVRFVDHIEPGKGVDSVRYWVEDVWSGQVIQGIKPAWAKPFKLNKEQMDKTK